MNETRKQEIERQNLFGSNPEQFTDIVEIIKEKIEIPHTILPYRRDGKFQCLPHQTEGLIKEGGIDRWAKGETTAANERRYILQMQQGKINYKEDGINSMDYEFLSIDTIYNRHKLINVKTKGYGI